MTLAEHAAPSLDEARSHLVDEWQRCAPDSADAVLDFYRSSEHLGAELAAWHQDPARQKWTEIVAYVAQQIGAQCAVDIGCGAGHELHALRDVGVRRLVGVEPNGNLADEVQDQDIVVYPHIDQAPIDEADLLLCLDVLEHVVDPEVFLAGIAQRAKPNTVLIESTATWDTQTPLHLKANRGWHPGHCLESYGFELLDTHKDRLRVWQRKASHATAHATALLCAYRACSIPTMTSMLALQADGWHVRMKYGDGLISRARSLVASRWWAETADDVFLMIDDDITFSPEMAARLVQECRNGYDIICAAYAIRDGGHLAIRCLDDMELLLGFGPGQPPTEIRYAATGFMAVHRRVLDALIPTLPLCHANQPWAFWPLFQPFPVEDRSEIGANYLSEDWAFCERARQAGFKVWLDPTIKLGHLAQIELTIGNMDAIHAALTEGK